MRKIINIAIIFMILGCWAGQELAYSSDIFYLRVPMGIARNRAAEILTRDGSSKGLPQDSQPPSLPDALSTGSGGIAHWQAMTSL